jgi:hypothetical protein
MCSFVKFRYRLAKKGRREAFARDALNSPSRTYRHLSTEQKKA